MSPSLPQFLYKYRSIENENKPEENNSIKALLSSYAYFSSRTNFNDLFDSKIGFKFPTAQQIKFARNSTKKDEYQFLNQCIKNGKLTPFGNEYLNKLRDSINQKVDEYLFFCVSGKNDSNLMWSHYANSHRGFCIEFKSEHIKADKVTYQEDIPTFDLSHVIAQSIMAANSDTIGKSIWQALRVKLSEWDYEDEYRFQVSKEQTGYPSHKGERSFPYKYSPDFVESIIFGCRINPKVRDYIKEKMPYPVKFKQAKEGRNKIEIGECK